MISTKMDKKSSKYMNCHQNEEHNQGEWSQHQTIQSHHQNDECRRQCSYCCRQMRKIASRRWSHSKRVNQHQISDAETRDLVGNKLFKRLDILPGIWEHCTKIIPTLIARSSVTDFLVGISAWCMVFGGLRGFLIASLLGCFRALHWRLRNGVGQQWIWGSK